LEHALSHPTSDIAIIGAGPYGLSIAAHLRKSGLNFRIFGTPMQSWRQQMPEGMLLKSDGFASSLYDPDSAFTLRHYCAEKNVPYSDVGIPVSRETFVGYGLEFQKRLVPMLEETNITSVRRNSAGFELQTADGQTVYARQVIVAAGITHFGYLPPLLADLPLEKVTHSSHHYDLKKFSGQKVAVIGGGSSAVDIAALLNEQGAEVHLIARRKAIVFHQPSQEPRPFLQRMKQPRSGLGLGWKSKFCTDAPLVFRRMPQNLRFKIVQRHLGPSAGWFVRNKFEGRVPTHLGTTLEGVSVESGKVSVRFAESDGTNTELVVDHVIGATGFRVAMSRLRFLDESLRQEVRSVNDTPVLSRNFESSVKGLYIVGVASANSFGPLTRFAYGAKFTAKHLTNHLAKAAKQSSREAVSDLTASSQRSVVGS
jgi:cation diffusion facilitator CzcD-associated flavoprotein CzcO